MTKPFFNISALILLYAIRGEEKVCIAFDGKSCSASSTIREIKRDTARITVSAIIIIPSKDIEGQAKAAELSPAKQAAVLFTNCAMYALSFREIL